MAIPEPVDEEDEAIIPADQFDTRPVERYSRLYTREQLHRVLRSGEACASRSPVYLTIPLVDDLFDGDDFSEHVSNNSDNAKSASQEEEKYA
jgi:hypothetical protein